MKYKMVSVLTFVHISTNWIWKKTKKVIFTKIKHASFQPHMWGQGCKFKIMISNLWRRARVIGSTQAEATAGLAALHEMGKAFVKLFEGICPDRTHPMVSVPFSSTSDHEKCACAWLNLSGGSVNTSVIAHFLVSPCRSSGWQNGSLLIPRLPLVSGALADSSVCVSNATCRQLGGGTMQQINNINYDTRWVEQTHLVQNKTVWHKPKLANI